VALSPADIEQFVRSHPNPYNLLLTVKGASVLDLGAGDLSFAEELVSRYLPALEREQKKLVVHCIERLHPDSQLGGRLHADPARLERLWRRSGLEFKFWSGRDMFELPSLPESRSRYTLVTCHAPATPTFAYEPSRLRPAVIEEHLRRTKGVFRKVRVNGEEALEVFHGGKSLLFPPWKFEIRGPLALFDLIARRGTLGLLAAVDREVFWELLAQLLEDSRVRPADVIFTAQNLSEIFGAVYGRLEKLPVGHSVILSELAELRREMPRVLPEGERKPYRFRHIEIRRGAVFEGLPTSQTARLFTKMVEEVPPWMLILVPEP
jgi:hypothetical protein